MSNMKIICLGVRNFQFFFFFLEIIFISNTMLLQAIWKEYILENQ